MSVLADVLKVLEGGDLLCEVTAANMLREAIHAEDASKQFPRYVKGTKIGLDKVARMLEYIKQINAVSILEVEFIKEGKVIHNNNYTGMSNLEVAEFLIKENK